LELDTVRESLRGTQANLQQARERRDVSLRQVEELRHLDSEARSKKERLPVLERDAVNTRAQAQQHQRHIEEYEALLADRDAVEKGYADLGTAKKCLEESIAAQAKHSELSQDIERVKGRIAAEAVRLSEQARQSEERIAKDLTPRAESVSRVQEEISSLNTQMEKLDLEEGALALERERLQDNVASIAQMKAETARLEEEGKRLRAQVTVLEQSPETAVCPLCKSPLGRDGVQHLRDTHNREIEEKRAAFKRMQADLRSLEEEHASQSRQLGQNEARLRRAQQAVQSRLDSLKRQQEEAQKASSELVSIRSALSQLTMRIEKGDFAAEERKRLALLESDLAALAYNPVRHEEIQQTVKRLSPFEKQHWRLSEAIERLPQERKARDLAHDMLERRQKEIASIQTGLAEVATALVQLPSREKELAVAESEVQRLEQEERDLIGKEGGFADRLKRIQQQEQKLHSLRRKQKSLAEEVEAFGELAEAFGRRGIQAMLIESVIPELEQQANDLLGRMTDNRMHLKLETQREARSGKGDLIETLDIHISDELGTRAYEMYSGGEAFRINLALRIALSRVLAQRKGAPLPVLFIDEGLGTQDSAGRERIIEVIQAIEPLFEKILVITHIEEVKESFPVRIEVQKREGSSTFVVT
jgi:exonuclease SbcC